MSTLSGKKDEYLVRVLVLFVCTKTFESMVTVEGEDFLDKREEKLCYELVTDANIFLYQQLENLSQHEFSEKRFFTIT